MSHHRAWIGHLKEAGRLVVDMRNCAELSTFSKVSHNQLTGVSTTSKELYMTACSGTVLLVSQSLVFLNTGEAEEMTASTP